MKSSSLKAGAMAGALVVALVPASRAVVIDVTAAADLGPVTTVSWTELEPAGISAASPATTSNSRGDTITASASRGSLRRLDEGTDFNGNFSCGDALLYLSGGGPLTLGFATPVSGEGLQVQSNNPGDFTATITAYSVDGTPLGSFSENGSSDSTEDGSAIFIGFRDTTADIARLTFTVGGGAFAVGAPSIGPSAAVPEPPASVIVVTSVLGLALTRRVL